MSSEPPIEMTEELLGLLDYLADIYYEKGEYSKAQPLFEKALAIRENTLYAEHLDVATSLNNLGFIYQEQAKLLFEKALIILQNRRGNNHPYVELTHNHLYNL